MQRVRRAQGYWGCVASSCRRASEVSSRWTSRTRQLVGQLAAWSRPRSDVPPLPPSLLLEPLKCSCLTAHGLVDAHGLPPRATRRSRLRRGPPARNASRKSMAKNARHRRGKLCVSVSWVRLERERERPLSSMPCRNAAVLDAILDAGTCVRAACPLGWSCCHGGTAATW